jgi:hypothetical protein
LFPFSRQILAEITREGGYPPLLINPIDFTPLYYQELRAREGRSNVAAGEQRLAGFQPKRAGAERFDERGMCGALFFGEQRRKRCWPRRAAREFDRAQHRRIRRHSPPLHRMTASVRGRL